MTPEVRDAIEAARQPIGSRLMGEKPARRFSFEHVHYTVLAVLREVPDGMTVTELRDELEISENQEPRT